MSRKLEQGGEVAHSDVIKAQIQANDQQRALQECPSCGSERALESGGAVVSEFLSGLHAGRRSWRSSGAAADDGGAADGGKKQSRAAGRLGRDGRSQSRSRQSRAPAIFPRWFWITSTASMPTISRVQWRWIPQSGIRCDRNAQHSGMALGSHREQGQAGRVAAASGEGGVERSATPGHRRSAVVLCGSADRARPARPPAELRGPGGREHAADQRCVTRPARPRRWRLWTRRTR